MPYSLVVCLAPNGVNLGLIPLQLKFVRKHDRKDEGFNWDNQNLDIPRSNSSEEGSSNQENIENVHDEEMKFIHDKIAWYICGL